MWQENNLFSLITNVEVVHIENLENIDEQIMEHKNQVCSPL